MRKALLVLIGVIILSACSANTNATMSEIDEYVEKLRQHSETLSDFEQYKADLEEFNSYLGGIKEKEYKDYVKIQIEANIMRIAGIEKMDSKLITDSSFKQAQALDILEEIKGAQ